MIGRLTLRDWILLATLLPLWLGCLFMHVREIERTGFAKTPIWVLGSSEPDGYPRVGGDRLERGRQNLPLRVGDRLIRIGDRDLRGTGRFVFEAIAYEEAGTSLRAPLVYEREGQRVETIFELRRAAFPWYRVIPVASWVLVSVLVLLRGARRNEARLFFAATVCIAIQTTSFKGGPALQTYAALGFFWLFGGLSFSLAILWARGFPYELPARKRVPAAVALIGTAFWIARIGYLIETPIPSQHVPYLVLGSDVLFIGTTFFLFTRNYFHAEPIGRRRAKWLLMAAALGIVPLILTLAAGAVFPRFESFTRLFEAGVMGVALVPIGFLIGITRYNLFDIDRLITATASYSLLGALLLAAALTVIPQVAAAAGESLGIDPATGQSVLSFALAMLIVPAHRRLRPRVERLLFRERHELQVRMTELLAELSRGLAPAALIQRLGERLDSLLKPESTIVYAEAGEGGAFEPSFVRGRAVPPAFGADSALVSAMKAREEPLVTEAGVDGSVELELGPFDRAALETLGSAVVMPVRRSGALSAFLCLGAMRSGDVYTRTDLALLAAITDRVSSELERFDASELLRAGREMQASLRRYVPGAVAEQLEAGRDLLTGEQQVTVLFVDIRSYTTYAESRRAEEIFSTVNQFTDAVSASVLAHGGSVVEFNGDGMMAVFGAPSALEEKERHAVDAGREICRAVDQMTLAATAKNTPLSVGVGIASGDAFVGNIQAVDRLIWSVIGNTTNLAARLQQLSRELGASIVIDAATFLSGGLEEAAWNHAPETSIRGRTEKFDLYWLP